MSVIISGKLIGPNGDPRPGVTIMLTAVKTSSAVIQLAPSSSTTDEDGSYSLPVEVGTHNVMIEAYGRPFEKVGQITVYVDSKPGTLNDFLVAPGADELTPAILAAVNEMRDSAKVYAERAKAAAQKSEAIGDNSYTYYITPEDPDGTIAGLAGTPVGKYFRVGQGPGNGFKYYLNDNGTAVEIASAPGAGAVNSPNIIENSVADESKKLPALTGAAVWNNSPSSAFAAYGVKKSVVAPTLGDGEPTKNYFFTHDLSFVKPGDNVAVSFLFMGSTFYASAQFRFADGTQTGGVTTEDLGNGIFRAFATTKVPAKTTLIDVNFGYQQRVAGAMAGEVALPMLAVSGHAIAGIGGDMSFADYQHTSGIIAPNLLFNGYADPKFQLPRLRVGSSPWVPVGELADPVVAGVLSDKGALQCLYAPPVASGYTDHLVEPWLDGTFYKSQYAAAQFYIYVAPGSGVDARAEVDKSAVFFLDENGNFTEIEPDIIERISDNLFKVRASYQYTAGTPRRISMGVRQSSTVSTFYVFGFFMSVAGQKIRDIAETSARDASIEERIDGNADNIAFNPSGDPSIQQQPIYSGSSAWTPVASLPAAVREIAQHGALAALPAPRASSGYNDGLVEISLAGVKAGDYVRTENYVYINADAGVDVKAAVITACKSFFYDSTFHAVTPTIKARITDNIYVVTAEYHYTADARRVIFGSRNVLKNADLYVFNTRVAVSDKTILKINASAVRDPLLNAYIQQQLSSDGTYPARLKIDTPIAGAENYILLSDQLFVPPETPLLLQCPQMLMYWTQDMNQFLDWTFIGMTKPGWPYSYQTNRTFEIDPDKLGSSVSIGFHDRQKPAQWSRRNVTIVRPPATATGTKNISLIGDSITHRGMSARVSALLRTAGLTINEIGTMQQQESGVGEGRTSWNISHVVGRRNVLDSQRIVISYDNPSTTHKNPFLFEATAAQLAAAPEMCFLNTGAVEEKSYAETQEGTFYTFDYRRYLDQQGFADPDVVSVSFAWNDGAAAIPPATYIAQMKYVVSQIKLACPDAIVAVAPYCHSYKFADRWNSFTSQYVRNTLGAFRNRQDEKIHVIPTWAILPTDTEWDSEGYTTTVDPESGSFVDTRGDGIHPNPHGRQYLAYQCLFPYYMWACTEG